LVSGGDDETVRFWDVAAAKEVDCLKVLGQQVQALALNHDSTYLAYAGVTDGDFHKPAAITLWDTRRRQPVATFSGHAGRVSSLAFTPGGDRLASAGAGEPGFVKVWDVAGAK